MQEEREIFRVKKTINCKGRLLSLENGCIMGILNTTPDSFHDGGRYHEMGAGLKQVEKMLKEGADIIDIGGYSTRPGADDVSEEEELRRTAPLIAAIIKEFPDALISIDTFRHRVAKEAIEAGAAIINDISAGEADEQMFPLVAQLQVPYIIMHMKGKPKTMQENPHYEDVVKELLQYFSFRLETLTDLGVHDVIIDPGFGFGKTLAHNYQLLKKLYLFRMLECPVLAGVSRKSMINTLLKTKPENSLNGTTIVNTLALMQGVDILRVHDVKEARQALTIINYYRGDI